VMILRRVRRWWRHRHLTTRLDVFRALVDKL
jgi:hypothetical protein